MNLKSKFLSLAFLLATGGSFSQSDSTQSEGKLTISGF
jgi:hypothetical protein